jgi:hypothetical protein
MTVWVDFMAKQGLWRHGNESCHLFGDDPAELHALASRIGLKRSWYQDKGNLPHYDLTRSKRAAAIGAGAAPLAIGPELKAAFQATREAAREQNQ